MLYDLHGVDERLRTKRQGLPSGVDFTVFYHCCRSNVTAT